MQQGAIRETTRQRPDFLRQGCPRQPPTWGVRWGRDFLYVWEPEEEPGSSLKNTVAVYSGGPHGILVQSHMSRISSGQGDLLPVVLRRFDDSAARGFGAESPECWTAERYPYRVGRDGGGEGVTPVVARREESHAVRSTGSLSILLET